MQSADQNTGTTIKPSAWQRSAAIFIASQTFSLFGSALVQYALFWYTTLETRSGFIMTVYILCGFVPTFLLSPFTGVLADRYDRKKLIMLADGLIALVTLALALVFMAGGKSLTLIMIAAACRAVGAALQGPAVGAFLPQFVPQEHLTRVNGISGTIQALLTIVSPVLSGALLSVLPIQTVFFIDVITAAIAILILLFFLRIKPHAKATQAVQVTYFTDMKLGFSYIKNHRYLISFFSFLGVLLFLIAPAAFLTPLQVVRSFGSEIWRLTAIEIAFSGGMMIGGVLVSIRGGLKNRMHTMLLSALVMALCNAGLGIAGIFWLYLAVMVIYGIALPFFNTPAAVIIQEHVESDYIGRVFSINTMLFTSAMPLGMLLFGPLAEVVRIEWLLFGTGAAMFLQALIAFGQKNLVAAGIPVVKPPSASDNNDPTLI